MTRNPVRNILYLNLIVLALIAVFSSCSKPKSSDARILFTTILPQREFVQNIAGDRYTVHALVGSGQSPHSYSPSPDQMAHLSQASLFFRIGIEVEDAVLPKIKKSMPNVQIIDLRTRLKLRDVVGTPASHSHGEEGHVCNGNCAYEGKDPHIWLSPPLVKKMALTIRDALVKIDPDGKLEYDKNLLFFNRKIDTLDTFIRTMLEPLKGAELFVYHPAFGYFADEYGLIQKPVETGGKEPSARDLAKLIDEAKEHKPKVIFVQPQYAQKSAEALARHIGCAVVPINPLPEDYFKEMREMVNHIHTGLNDNE